MCTCECHPAKCAPCSACEKSLNGRNCCSQKKIDWTSPVRWDKNTTSDHRSLQVKAVGITQVCVMNTFGHVYLVDISTGHVCEPGLEDWAVENYALEKWANLYKSPLGNFWISQGEGYNSEEEALSARARPAGLSTYVKTVRVQ